GPGILGGFVGALALAIGLVFAGMQVGQGFVESRLGDRSVTVKGLAEREVKADLAMWPLKFARRGNNLVAAQEAVDADIVTVRRYLIDQGFNASEIEPQKLEVRDEGPGYGNNRPVERYTVIQTLLVRSENVDLVADTSRKTGDLVKQGIVVFEDWAAQGASFIFTGLNEIKPGMIAEATQDARSAGEQFANDSGATLGGIKTANQGYFSVSGRDEIPGVGPEQQINKKVRVVTTVTYYLDD
ncbi:MAG: SIMPL domain-containing protein, partial [Pseudomonadota bacterium]